MLLFHYYQMNGNALELLLSWKQIGMLCTIDFRARLLGLLLINDEAVLVFSDACSFVICFRLIRENNVNANLQFLYRGLKDVNKTQRIIFSEPQNLLPSKSKHILLHNVFG